MQEVESASDNVQNLSEQRTLSDFLDEGDLAAGLQAWLKLTNNTISGMDSDVCIVDEGTADPA